MAPTNGPILDMLGKKFFSSLCASVVLLFSANALATLTYSSATGVSNVDTTDPTKVILFGAFAGSCTASNTGSTCNSCSGTVFSGTGLLPCSQSNVSANTTVSIVITINNTAITAPTNTTTPTIKIGGSTGNSVGTNNWTVGASTFTVTVPWGDLCNGVTSGSTDCSTNLNADLYIAFENIGGGTATTDSVIVKIVTRFAKTSAQDSSWNYVDCPTDPDPNTEKVGFCHFKVFPGDKKIYADGLAVSTSFPTSPSTGAPYKAAVFLYEIQQTGETDAQTVARITNASPSKTISVGTVSTGSDPLSDSRIEGLTNGSRYCMVMASQDQTGVISFFTPTATNAVAPAVAVSPTTLCTSPEPVVGLLDDKHCFIATAAFGSDMAPEVQSFRDFRNKYLLPFSWGQKFVKTYYKYSPKYAELIAGNDVAKAVVRGALWPLLLFARMSVAFGFWVTLLIMATAVLTFVELYRRLILGRNVRGEL